MRIGVEHQVVSAVHDEQTWALVVVQIELLENVEVAAGTFYPNGPGFVGGDDGLLDILKFQAFEMEPVGFHAKAANSLEWRETGKVENRCFARIGPVVDTLPRTAALVEVDCRICGGTLPGEILVNAASNPHNVPRRSCLLRSAQ